MFIVWGKADGSVAVTAIALGMRLVSSLRPRAKPDDKVIFDPPLPLEMLIGPRNPADFMIGYAETKKQCADRLVQHFRGNIADETITSAQVVSNDEPTLPRRFRKAWRHADGQLTVDMAEARQAVIKELRALRDDALTESDKDQSRLNDVGTDQQKQDLKKYRRSLRDLPAQVQSQLAGITDLAQLNSFKLSLPSKPS